MRIWVEENGKELFLRFVEDLGLPHDPDETALILAAFLSYGNLTTPAAKNRVYSCYTSFLVIMSGIMTSGMQLALRDMAYLFCFAVAAQLGTNKSHNVVCILKNVLDLEALPKENCEHVSKTYWENRFEPCQSHDEAIIAMQELRTSSGMP